MRYPLKITTNHQPLSLNAHLKFKMRSTQTRSGVDRINGSKPSGIWIYIHKLKLHAFNHRGGRIFMGKDFSVPVVSFHRVKGVMMSWQMEDLKVLKMCEFWRQIVSWNLHASRFLLISWFSCLVFVLFLNFAWKTLEEITLRCWKLKPSSLLLRLQDFLTTADERLQHLQSLDVQKVSGFYYSSNSWKHIITQFVRRIPLWYQNAKLWSAWYGQRFRFLSNEGAFRRVYPFFKRQPGCHWPQNCGTPSH